MEKVKLQLEVSEEAKRNLKIHAVLTDQSMSEAIDEILTNYLTLIRGHKNVKEDFPAANSSLEEGA